MTKGLCLTFMLLLAMAFSTSTQAQNVTISPSTGKLIAALTYENEQGFQHGWSALWKHDQLPLTFSLADDPNLTEGGEFSIPADNISLNNDKYVIAGGQTKDMYCVISLPKGYRITGYKIVLLNDLNGKTVNNLRYGSISKRFYETDKDFDYTNFKASTPVMGATNTGTQEYVIERESHDPSDMGNQLYFRMHQEGRVYFGATVKSIELFFTAEGDFTAPVYPFSANGEGTSFVEVPFLTSKIDLGDIKPRTKDGKTFYSYDYRNVKDLTANNVLYEQGAVSDGKVAEVGDRSITSINNGGNLYFALGGNHTYFVETPTEVTTQNDTKSPIHYRIVGAKVNYSRGTETQGNENSGFQITIEKNGTTYYLNTNGDFVATSQTIWKQEGNKIRSGNYYLNASGQSNDYILTITTSSGGATDFTIDGSNRIYYRNPTWFNTTNYYLTATDLYNPKFTSGTTDVATKRDVAQEAFTPQDYTLTVYDKNGTNVLETVAVTEGNASGSVEFTDINNDAIKFAISGLPEGGKALVTIDLTLESLNPYINRLNLVCQETGGNGRMLTQQFTSNNFAVSGGKFYFYVPDDFDAPCQITFRDLYSSYGDNTYYEGLHNGHARYSLVMSDYWTTNNNLYAGSYNPDADYKTKVRVDVSGTKNFRFNNADELGNTSGSTETKNYEEYPFSLSAYGAEGGSFEEVIFNSFDENEKKCYLFTCDETRYNIAPTTASEHRYYAYYIMDIELEKKTYTAGADWTKIYEADKTCYDDGTVGGFVQKDLWGMKLKTTEASGEGEYGYLTVDQISNLITEQGITKDQILYVDGSELLSIVNENEDVSGQATDELAQFYEGLGKNALVFLPEGTTYNKNNFAYKTMSGTFRACNNIILTDKIPFYSPYDIQVESANKAVYTREITWQPNGKVTNASLILPFELSVDDTGLHQNQDDNCSFRLHQMNATNCLSIEGAEDESPKNYFGNITMNEEAIKVTEPNRPYIVEVISAPAEDSKSFVAEQKGAFVAATTLMNADEYTFTGETATGSINNNTFTFVNHGSFSGKRLDKTVGYFYFAKNMFINSKNLRPDLPYVYVYPFRSYYSYTGSGKLNSMEIVYGENPNTPTGIIETESNPDMVVKADYGMIIVSTAVDNSVAIRNVSGMCVKQASMKAGETRTFNVPAGIYIINGVKIIVR